MKIVQVVAYYPPHLGGMQNAIKGLSENLARRGHQVQVFTSDIGCKRTRLITNKNLKVHRLTAWELVRSSPILPSLFFKLIKIPKNSIIHLHIAQVFIPEIVFLVSKLKGIPYITHIRLDVEPTTKWGLLLPIYKKVFLSKVLKSSLRIIVPTKGYIDLINKKYKISKNKIYVIPNGVDFKNFKSLSKELHNPVRLLFVGRLSIQKNVPLLIKSFKLITEKKFRDVELHIVGDGEEKDKIINLIKKEKLEKKIVLHGVLRGRKLYEIYSSSDIFIMTSKYESFGNVLIEAMASGLPIIASDILAVRNVIENNKNGLLVKQTPEDFAIAIEKLLDNSQLRERIIENALEEVKKYNWDKIVEKFEKVYIGVLNENK